LIGGIGEPIAAGVAQVPFALVLGLGPASDTGNDSVINFAGLIP